MSKAESKKTGRLYDPNTAIEYAKTAALRLSELTGSDVLPKPHKRFAKMVRAVAAAKPTGERRKRQGLRHAHLRKAARARVRTTPDEWAAVCCAVPLLLRGGEVRHIRQKDVSFERRHGRKCLIVQVKAIKQARKRAGTDGRRYEHFIPEAPGDAACAFAAVARILDPHWSGRGLPNHTGARSASPLFRGSGGGGMSTSQVRRVAKTVGEAAGLPRRELGAHSCRIGGATDHRDGGGDSEGLRKRGRWMKDIGEIYARDTIERQIEEVDKMRRSRGETFEARRRDFTQPAGR